MADLTCRPLGRDDFPRIERLFGPNGAASGCWCMYFNIAGGNEWRASRGEPNRTAFAARIAAGEVHAILALDGDDAVGYCRFGPRASFERIDRSRVLARPPDENTWSVVCFFVHRRARRRGVAHALLQAATDHAFAAGAAAVEAYPAVPPKGGRLSGAFAFSGLPRLYEAAGFTAVPNPAGVRPIWRRTAV